MYWSVWPIIMVFRDHSLSSWIVNSTSIDAVHCKAVHCAQRQHRYTLYNRYNITKWVWWTDLINKLEEQVINESSIDAIYEKFAHTVKDEINKYIEVWWKQYTEMNLQEGIDIGISIIGGQIHLTVCSLIHLTVCSHIHLTYNWHYHLYLLYCCVVCLPDLLFQNMWLRCLYVY